MDPKGSVSLNDQQFPELNASTSRVSVFKRLTPQMDARLKFTDGEKARFADIVGSSVSTKLTFFPPGSKADVMVSLPVELAKQAAKTYHSTLFGYFLGPRIPFLVVQQAVKKNWGKFGFQDLMMNANGVYFLKFNDEGGCAQVIEQGPLFIRGAPFFVDKWDPARGLTKPVHSTCPLWIKLHNFPLVAFNVEGIGRIASALGIPKQMDSTTASMCDNAWGRPGFAKVLVDTWAVGELKREIEVVVPSLTDAPDVKVKVRVEYLWEPVQYGHCLVFGHRKSTCAKAKMETEPKEKVVEKDSDGFTTVQGDGNASNVMETMDSATATVSPTTAPQSLMPEGGLMSGSGTSEQMETNVSTIDLRTDESSSWKIDTPMGEKVTSPTGLSLPSGDGIPKASDGDRLKLPVGDPKLKLPIKGILKNPNANRFSSLADDDGNRNRVLNKDSQGRKGGMVGMNTPDKQQEIRSLVRNCGLHVCAILESHLRAEVINTTCDRLFSRWAWVSNQALSTSGTRIIVAWDLAVVDIMVLESHAQFIHCQVRLRDSNEMFFVSFVYGANRGSDRHALWSGLRKFKVLMGDKPWLVMGDFNCLLFPHDALGGTSRRNRDMMEFALCVEDDAVARFLPRGLSDHSPGLITFKGLLRKRNFGFKFDNFLANDAQFLPIVKRCWDVDVEGTFMFRLTSKLKSLKSPLRKLRASYGNLTEKTVVLKHELDTIQLAMDLDPSNETLREDLQHLRVAYQRACWNDMSASRQRAKVKWLSEGDSNTRYFHQVVKEKRHVHQIHSVCNSAGVFVYDMEVATAFIDHFKSIIGTVDSSVVPIMDEALFPARLSLADSNYMIRPILDDEIKDAIFQIGNDKAPGSDGFSSKFYKAAWEVIGKDVLVAIHNFFYRGRLAKELNHTLLCLLQKSVNATTVSDYRPIACCSVLYKCIAKVLVERIKPFLGDLVSISQSAFIPGRKISDNILMAHELVVGYHLERGPPRCAFKIDLRKAYDMVSWEYLFNMMMGFGFHPALVAWIKEMVSTTTFSIALNGETFGYFEGKRGIRQGDPLSPYLFTLIMEGFTMLFRQCIAEASAFGYHHGCAELEITHLCFADDLFVFTHGDVASVGILKKALELFASKSGLSPNLQKSDVFFGNVPNDEKNAILACLPFREGAFPIRYLGVPLSPVLLKPADYGVMIAKVKDRIQNWKSKFLSFGGRRQLIMSVLQSLQLYWMAVFVFPSVITHDLEACCRDFLWAQGDSSRGKCKVAWSLVCRPRDCGGLGIKRLSVWNRAIITKNLWTIVTNHNSLWVRWIRSYSLRNGLFWSSRKNNRWSWLFSKMMSLRNSPVSEFQASSFTMQTTARQLVDAVQSSWPSAWVDRVPLLAMVALPNIQPSNMDVFCWDSDTDEFSVKKAYVSLTEQFPKLSWTKKVWFKGHIPKHSFCLWLACLNRLPTQDQNMSWKHEPPDLRCSLCNLCMDSHAHLFFECVYAQTVWQGVRMQVGWIDAPSNWDMILENLCNPALPPTKLMHRLALAATVYMVWNERNRRIFTENKTMEIQLIRNIMDAVLNRMAWKTRKTLDAA
ncbi:hypothetical protein OSB04_001084 [Centaurea solstitialis]|uniref:Reverse transcriptase domain-containing protein n=1 Tax=Centaurea solstitialis TaxID=347529 RepID=A0AA38U9J9_9ASTR|nr:hypothetical protein OSB04_001084 [Centaurea solstitialis]